MKKYTIIYKKAETVTKSGSKTLVTKVYINENRKKIANSYQHFQQVFQQR